MKKPSKLDFVPLREALRPGRVLDLMVPTDFAKLVGAPALLSRFRFAFIGGMERPRVGGVATGRKPSGVVLLFPTLFSSGRGRR